MRIIALLGGKSRSVSSSIYRMSLTPVVGGDIVDLLPWCCATKKCAGVAKVLWSTPYSPAILVYTRFSPDFKATTATSAAGIGSILVVLRVVEDLMLFWCCGSRTGPGVGW